MKLELEVLASTSIKRKKPWARLAWIGGKQESIFLIDEHRMSVLYVPSGKTKKKISKLHGVLPNVTAVNHSHNGHFLVGLLRSGDFFIFHKDTETLKYAQGINDLVYMLDNLSNNANKPNIPIEAPKPEIFISDDGRKVVVLINISKVYVWEQDADQNLFAPKRIDVKGSWCQVKPSPTVPLPSPSARECSLSAVFFQHQVLGLCCSISFVFTIGQCLNVTTAVIRWYDTQHLVTYSKPTFFIEWTNVKHPLADISKDGCPVRSAGAYVCKASHDGQLLATAVNQKVSHANRMVFISPLTDVFVITDLKGSGARTATNRNFRTYWVTSMEWTLDDLLLVTMTNQGSLAILTRLGEPLLLKTFGCSIEMGPRHYLPLHPLISVQTPKNDVEIGDNVNDEGDGLIGDVDPMRQRYSLTCHPRKAIILCSDGYMVTALQLPVDITSLSLMKGLVMESTSHLRRIRDLQKINLTLYDSMRRQGRVTKKLSLSGGTVGGRRVPNVTSKSMSPRTREAYRFEEPDEEALNTTLDDDETATGNDVFTSNMESGKIFFGDLDQTNNSVDLDVSAIDESLTAAQLIEQARSALLLAWSLGASNAGLWTEEHEEVATNIAHNLVRLFSVILQSSPEVLKDLEILHSYHLRKIVNVKNLSLVLILHTIKCFLKLLHLDAPYQHLMVCAVRFAHSTLKLFLRDPSLAKREPKTHTLHGCYTLLKVFEQHILCVYTSLPKTGYNNDVDGDVEGEFGAVYEPATGSLYKNKDTAIVTDVTPGYELHGQVPHQRKLIRPKPGEEEQEQMRNAQTYTSDIDKRLIPVWRLLYKHVVGFYTTKGASKAKAETVGPLQDLLVSVQMKLTSLGHPSLLTPARKTKVQPGDRLSIEGCSVPALKAWMYQLNVNQGKSSVVALSQRFLLSTLYSLLLQDELRAAIELTELLLKLPDIKSAVAVCRQDQATKWSTLAKLCEDPGTDCTEPPRPIQNEAVQAVVTSIGRIMAAYFSNQTLFVFPPHAPRVIPPLHTTYTLDHRVIPMYHESLSNVIRTDGLDGVWTVERAMEYLLLAGLLPEAVWLANSLGDWKTAFIIGVAHLEQKQTKTNKKHNLPKSLLPEALLQTKLAQDFGLDSPDGGILLIDEETDMPQLRRSLNDLMLAATLSQIDLVPWLLEGLVLRLKHVCSEFTALVPSALYLPAPPVYCPQPANTSQAGLGEDAKIEVRLRHQASSLIQLVFLVLEGSNCTLPASRWYARQAEQAGKLGNKFKMVGLSVDEPDIPVLQEWYINKDSAFLGKEADPSIHRILAAYRDFTSLVWMLYVRDKLSLGLRKKIQLLDRKMQKSPVPADTWLKHCRDTLEWAIHLIPFAHFLQAENDIFGIALSLITELPSDAHTCHLLSLFFHDAESLDPEIQDKLQSVLKDWQGIFLESAYTPRGTKMIPRGTSMSFYFHKLSQKMDKFYKKKAKVFGKFEMFVFDAEDGDEVEDGHASNGINCIGSRPFESTEAFLSFLDVFYAVSYHKLIDAEESTPPQMPLLSANSSAFRKKELTSFAHKAVTSLHRKQTSSDIPTSPHTSFPDLSGIKNVAPPTRPKPPSSPRAKIGLFRSRSFSELSSKKAMLPPRSPSIERRKSSSHQDLRSLDDERGFLELHTTKPGSSRSRFPPLLKTQTHRTTSGSDTLLSADGVVPKMSLTRKCEIRRSSSVNDVDQARREKERTKKALPQVDPLLKPVTAHSALERMEFDKKYHEVEQLLEWLSRWSARNHNISNKTEHQVISSLSTSTATLNTTIPSSPFKASDLNKSLLAAGVHSAGMSKPVMRIRVQTRLVVYSLWLIEHDFSSKRREEVAEVAREASEAASNASVLSTTNSATFGMGTDLDTGPFINTDGLLQSHSQQPSSSIRDGTQHAKYSLERESQARDSQARDSQAKDADLRESQPRESQIKKLHLKISHPKKSHRKDSDRLDDLDGETTDPPSEWFDPEELEESYIAQMISAESNESISDGYIPRPKKKKKKSDSSSITMGILKRKKDRRKKAEDEGQSTPSVGTSETLLKRLSFRAGAKGSQDAQAQAPNTSQVSDSTLNVSSLNDEELHETLRLTIRQTNHATPTSSQKARPEASNNKPPEEMPRRSRTPSSVPDTRLDLQALEASPDGHGPDDPGDLRHIVRQELRKIVTAQHRGILAMLGALGEGEMEEDLPLGASTPHDRKDRKQKVKKRQRRAGDKKRAQDDVHDPRDDMSSLLERSSLTEVDITPLPSDEISIKSDNPLTVADLFKSRTWSPGARYEAGGNVRGALKELKVLENTSHGHNHVHFDLESDTSAHPKGGKENIVRKESALYANKLPSQGPSHEGQQPSQVYQQGNAIPDTNQPFARVFHMLKAFNESIKSEGNVPGPSQMMNPMLPANTQPQAVRMPLLRLDAEQGSQSTLRFPPVGFQGARPTPPPPPQPQQRGTPRMPLLQLYTPHHRDEVPVKDVHLIRVPPRPHAPQVHPGSSAMPTAPRMPLLRLEAPAHQRVFQHIEDEQGDLHLVPDEDLQAYEARLQVEKERKLEQRRKQMEALGMTAPPVEAVKKQERRREKRRQRRQKLEAEDSSPASEEEDATVKFQLETSSQYVQADPILTSTQEVQVTYTPTPRDQRTQGAQYPTPRDPGEEGEEEDEEGNLAQAPIHHGYALTPGLFDDYLTKDQEMGTALDNSARTHYRAVSRLQPKRLKEVGTGTEGPGWTDQGTTICRDQGTDPVTEAIEAYNKAKQGLSAQGLLAPDVFMGLKFSEAPQDTASDEGASAGRAFINVVDLDGAALDDIVSSVRDRDSSQPSRVKTARARRTPSPEKSQDGPRVHYDQPEEVADLALGPDRVTREVLSRRDTSMRDSREWDSAVIQSARSQAKGSIRHRLGNMEAQFQAIDAMSKNIEEDYKNARRMIHTIEQIGEAIQPSPDLDLDESEDLETSVSPRHSPRRSARKQTHRERDSGKPSPIPEVSDEGRSSARSRVRISQESFDDSRIGSGRSEGQKEKEERQKEKEERQMDEEEQPDQMEEAGDQQEEEGGDTRFDLTGLSGVSDIIGEVIASGKVDASKYGLTDRQSHRLTERARSAREEKEGLDELLRSGEMQKEQEKRSKERSEKEKAELRAWMDEKRRQRMEEFRQRQQELREREHEPYKAGDESAQMSTLTMRELEEFEHKRVESKKQREMEYAERRRMEASQLMGDILTDRPHLPAEPASTRQPARKRTSSVSPLRKGKSVSPARRTSSKSPARKQLGQHQGLGSQRQAWGSDPDRINIEMNDLRHVKDSGEYDRQFRHSGEAGPAGGGRRSGVMSGSGLLNTQTGTSSAGLRAYTQALENVQSSYDPESEALHVDTTQDEEERTEPSVPLYKPKPYHQVVKMQRPEVTRQTRFRPGAKPYVDRLSEVSKTEETPRTEGKSAVLAQQRLYGTKRLPGTQSVRTAPRTVKTYQERLREMKQARQKNPGPIRRYTGPIRANGSTFTRPMVATAKPKKKQPRKKPMTYQEQLQALQPPKELYRTGTLNMSTTSDPSRPRKRKGPAHKPQTYAEQLQALQPPKELYRTATLDHTEGPSQSQAYRSPPKNALRRSGPYPDPYTPAMYNRDVDRASVVSSWSVDDDVRRLIYDGASSTHVGASVAGTDLDMSELQDLAGFGNEAAADYSDLVDVREIADAASVSEGSIMSFIDWDQVNDLIADVY